MALKKQLHADSVVRFRQIELENSLSKLFVDLDVNVNHFSERAQDVLFMESSAVNSYLHSDSNLKNETTARELFIRHQQLLHRGLISALSTLLAETNLPNDHTDSPSGLTKILLEGGPGQGKSTVTQMVTQIYRQQMLDLDDTNAEGRWPVPSRARLPFRIELRKFGEWLQNKPDSSVEQYIAVTLSRDSGGVEISVDQLHNLVTGMPILLVFDGLDEVGSDDLRNIVLEKIGRMRTQV